MTDHPLQNTARTGEFVLFQRYRVSALISSVQNHTRAKTKKPKIQSLTENAGTVLFFWIFGFVFLDFCFFWFCKNPKIQRTKNPKIQNCPHILRETLDFCFFGFGCILVPVTASASIQIIIPLLKLN